MGVRDDQRERTHRALLDAAERLFARDGYGAVGLPAVVAAAGVTKGALYHQFDGKAAVFAAVLDRVADRVAGRVVAAAEAVPDPWGRLVAGCRAFLDASTEPSAARIMLVDGPAVLGWADWRERDARSSGRHLVEALEELVGCGELTPQPVGPLARLLSGAMNELAMWLAEPGTTDADRAAAGAALDRVLDGLRVRPADRPDAVRPAPLRPGEQSKGTADDPAAPR
ncbi:TetR/AcrR family transcriptional regulator [Pseudonocardia spirodelae]|uniref:TetR/AcrR family transcriptional regulator n=1 Tax=Pseudonocardia spirodelae TaxID=3133431 RepID=A0ABU8T3J7_9PSEU